MFIQCKQTGHVTSEETVGDLSEPAGVSVGSDDVEDFGSGLRVAADAHGVLVWVKHWSVIIQVLHLHMYIGLSTQASLSSEKNTVEICGSNLKIIYAKCHVHGVKRPPTGSSALIRMSWAVCPESRSIS